MTEGTPRQPLWQVLEAQADDLFALYQLAHSLAEAADLDELVHLALPQLVRVGDCPYAALFLPLDDDRRLDLVGWIGADFDAEDHPPAAAPSFPRPEDAVAWFSRACDVAIAGCSQLRLDVGRSQPGLLLLAAPSKDGFTHHQHHLLATMAREVARALHLALARADLHDRMRRVEQMQADFVSTVSHELRTPLARIRGYVDSLTHLPLSAEQQRRFIEDIGQATAQITRIVETVLDFSQVDAGRLTVDPRPIDLAAAVASVMADLDPPSQARLRCDVPHLSVQADAARLAQVLGNLLSNALKYSPVDAPVSLRARASRRRGVARLAVLDRGRGVPPEDLPYLFTRFFRARNVRESHLVGTGLGLYICKQLLEAQGGTIRLRSRLGSGTVVLISLPLAASTVATNP